MSGMTEERLAAVGATVADLQSRVSEGNPTLKHLVELFEEVKRLRAEVIAGDVALEVARKAWIKEAQRVCAELRTENDRLRAENTKLTAAVIGLVDAQIASAAKIFGLDT